ncbi:hypothetical protein [Listeria booriae]|uniref:hypothetical protein n=1 Tax=Listeria booriae TaxID=1552123 RepID=UPI00162AE6C7|nr:hypothetical protein [Listeria booriae]MBC2106129.1 hypothetical protein [Listeria booriae]
MGNIEITKREILVAIIIFCIMMGVGFFIYDKVVDAIAADKEVYETALKIKNKDDFDYSIETQQGNIIVEADFKARDTVTFPELKNSYMYIAKKKEEYTMHTRTYTDDKGNMHTETYWTWDYAGKETKQSKLVKLFERTFPAEQFNLIHAESLDIQQALKKGYKSKGWNVNYYYTSDDIRYYYEVVPIKFQATFLAKAGEKGLQPSAGGKIGLYEGSMESFIKGVETGFIATKFIFWAIWIVVTLLLMYAYVSRENEYLED